MFCMQLLIRSINIILKYEFKLLLTFTENPHGDLRGEDDGSEDEAAPAPNDGEFKAFQGYEKVGNFDAGKFIISNSRSPFNENTAKSSK